MGSTLNKYRVHEVAKDFGLPTKTVAEILTKYASAPKNHMQVLDDRELSLIFEYLTQHNQVSGIEVIFADAAQESAKKPAEPAPAPAEAKPAQKGAQPQAAPASQPGRPQGAQPPRPAQPAGTQPAQQQASRPSTRSASRRPWV